MGVSYINSWQFLVGGNLQLRTPRVYGPGLTNLSATSACCHVQLAATLGDKKMSAMGGIPMQALVLRRKGATS